MRGFVSFEVPLRHSVLVTMRTLHATLNPHSRPHYYRSCRCRLLHAGRQRAQSCVDENEPWSSTDLHVGITSARPSQEEVQFCLAAAQQPRPHCTSASHEPGPTKDFAEGGCAPWPACPLGVLSRLRIFVFCDLCISYYACVYRIHVLSVLRCVYYICVRARVPRGDYPAGAYDPRS